MKAPKRVDQAAAAGQVRQDATFGRANRPSTPIKGVICGDYELAAENLFKEKAEAHASMKRNKSLARAKGTKAQELAAVRAQQKIRVPDLNATEVFKMKKFTSVPSKVVSHRGPAARAGTTSEQPEN